MRDKEWFCRAFAEQWTELNIFEQVNGSRLNGDIVLPYEGHLPVKGAILSKYIHCCTYSLQSLHPSGRKGMRAAMAAVAFHSLTSSPFYFSTHNRLQISQLFLGPRTHLPFELLTVLCFYTSTFLSSPTARHTSQWRKTFRHFPSCLNPFGM